MYKRNKHSHITPTMGRLAKVLITLLLFYKYKNIFLNTTVKIRLRVDFLIFDENFKLIAITFIVLNKILKCL